MDIIAREILCPKEEEHIHKKILLVLGDDYIGVHCSEHRWLKIELYNPDGKIDFKGARAEISSFGEGVNFQLSPIPGVAKGEFRWKREGRGKHYKN